jgi:hypothetical protein
MFGLGWLTLRQAREAIRTGRLEDALRLLLQPGMQGRRGVADLLQQLARGYVERGERALQLEDAEGAWRSLLQGEHLQTGEKSTDRLRQALVRLGLAEVRALLQAGEPKRADEAEARLRERGVRTPEMQVLAEITRAWLEAEELAGRGELTCSIDRIDRVLRLLPIVAARLEPWRKQLGERQERFAGLLVRLHEAADAERWREVIDLAEQVLQLAPHHGEARKARSRAWKAIEPVTVSMRTPHPSDVPEQEVACEGLPPRFLLWIDGVGGYLVCLGNRLTFGQALLDGRVDVPLVADVSRMHATLTRDAEGYVLEAIRPIQVNGYNVTRALLQQGDRVTLGTSCQFQFRMPVPVSTSARLDLVSGHRLPLAIDGILVMADTLLLGSEEQVHIEVPDLEQPLVLFRNKETLGIRHRGKLFVNGSLAQERCLLGSHATVTAGDVTLAIEPVRTRLVPA